MTTGIKLHPIAKKRLEALKTRLASEESEEASERKILAALAYGTTPAQAAGMLREFTRRVAAYNEEQKQAQTEDSN